MGRDKGLLEKDGVIWAQYMADKLSAASHLNSSGQEASSHQKTSSHQVPDTGTPIFFSINPSQLSAYRRHIDPSLLIVDSPALSAIAGPLKGLLSAHEQFPGADLLLLACDMIDLDEDTIRTLMAAWSGSAEANRHDFYVYAEGDFAQPFCGIYTSAGLAAVHTIALQGRLVDFSLQSLLRKGKTLRMPIRRMEAFRNYNVL